MFFKCKCAELYVTWKEEFTCAYKWLAETDINALPPHHTAGSYLIWVIVVANIQEYF